MAYLIFVQYMKYRKQITQKTIRQDTKMKTWVVTSDFKTCPSSSVVNALGCHVQWSVTRRKSRSKARPPPKNHFK